MTRAHHDSREIEAHKHAIRACENHVAKCTGEGRFSFKKDGTVVYSLHITELPTGLVVSGDCGNFLFKGYGLTWLDDCLEFVKDEPKAMSVSWGYLEEKLGMGRNGVQVWSYEVVEAYAKHIHDEAVSNPEEFKEESDWWKEHQESSMGSPSRDMFYQYLGDNDYFEVSRGRDAPDPSEYDHGFYLAMFAVSIFLKQIPRDEEGVIIGSFRHALKLAQAEAA